MRLTRSGSEFGIASPLACCWMSLRCWCFLRSTAWAGPPFQTDDPEPVDFRHYEFCQFGQLSSTPIETDPTGPALEFNWGCSAERSAACDLRMGRGDPLEQRCLCASRHWSERVRPGRIPSWAQRFASSSRRSIRPEIGSFTMLELPTGSHAKGLGVGRVWYRLPVWVQKDYGRLDDLWRRGLHADPPDAIKQLSIRGMAAAEEYREEVDARGRGFLARA